MFFIHAVSGLGIVVSCLLLEPVFPIVFEATTAVEAAQGADIFAARVRPESGRLFAAAANDRFAAGNDNA